MKSGLLAFLLFAGFAAAQIPDPIPVPFVGYFPIPDADPHTCTPGKDPLIWRRDLKTFKYCSDTNQWTILVSLSGAPFTQTGTGAVQRTVASKLQDIVNVKDFGALCDGSTNDSPAFQRAHDALPVGGTINMPPGTCVLLANINHRLDNIKWRGAGRAATRLQMGPSVTKLFNVTNGSSVTQLVLPEFSDFTVDGSAAAAGVAFYLNGVRSASLQHLYTVQCFKSYFIDQGALTTSTVTINDFFIEDTPDVTGARGIQSNGGGDAFFISNGRMFRNSHGVASNSVGLDLVSGGGFMIDFVDVSSFGRACLIDPGANQFVRYSQIHALQCDTSAGTNLTVDGTAAFGSGNPYGVYGIHFIDCWFSTAGAYGGGNGYGIDLVSAVGLVFDNSQVYDNSLDGVRIRSGANHITISGGQIAGNSNGFGNGGANVNTYNGVTLDASVDTVAVINITIGVIGYRSFSHKYGVQVGAGAVNYTVTGNNLENNVTGTINDLSAAASGQVARNLPVAALAIVYSSSPVAVPLTGGYYYNNASGAITFNLPTIAPNMLGSKWCFRSWTGKTGVITLQLPSATVLDIDGASGASAGFLTSGGALGDYACVVAATTGQYEAEAPHGTWTNH